MKRGIYALLLTGLLLLGGYVYLSRRNHVTDEAITAPLKDDENQKIILDPSRHTVTTIRRSGTTRTFLNTHGPVSIVEKRDGSTVLVQRTWGTIHDPFVAGAFGSDFRFRIAGGVNLFYIQRWECGGGLLLQPGDVRDVRAFVHVGYNVYGNWLVSAAIDHKQTVHVLASLRF